MTAAIHYVPDGYVTTRKDLKGRHAAGLGFLRGMAKWTDGPLTLAALSAAHARHGAELVAADLGRREVRWAPLDQPAVLADPHGPGCLFSPGPGLGPLLRTRQRVADPALWSVCGVTHTTASERAMEDLSLTLLTAPYQPWDAIICTSSVVRASVQRMVQMQAEELSQRFGATRFPLPQLPVIPLGVHCDDFRFSPDQRAEARAALGLTGDDVMLLFVGRLSFHAKAHPLPMYLAAQRVAATLPPGQHLHLVECGWFANDSLEKAFRDGATALMPGVRHHVLDGRDPATTRRAWAAADIFVSLSDNIQETFGLTPVEAMAAGLPVLVSDWDGYKDTVRHEVDGFRVPTLTPPPGLGTDLATRHDMGLDTYDLYCGYASQLTAVDTGHTEQMLAKLVHSPDLRRLMGQAGQARAREAYDWKTVIGQYQALWADLAARRQAARQEAGRSVTPRQPATRLDPWALFLEYPTRQLADDLLVTLGPDPDPLAALTDRRALAMVSYSEWLFPTADEARTLLDRIGQGTCRVKDLLPLIAPQRQAQVARGLVWLAKLDIIRIRPAPFQATGQTTGQMGDKAE